MDKVNTQAKDNIQAHVIDIYFRLFSVAKSKDMDSGEIVVSSIRTGMKREFAMMMKAQSEIGGLPEGGRRMTRSQSTAGSSKGYVRSADKFRGTDGDSTHEDERPVGETTDLRMKMSKKVELSRIPTKSKDLLQTGRVYLFVAFMAPRSPLAGPSAPASSSRKPMVSESAQISSDSQPQTKCQGMLTRKVLRMHKSDLAEDMLPKGTALSYVIHRRKSLRITRKMVVSFACAIEKCVSASAIRRAIQKPWIIYRNMMISVQYNALVSQLFPGGYGTANIAKTCSKRKSLQSQMQMHLLTQRCIHVVGTLEPEIGGCAICRFSARRIVICDQCEKEYHVGRLKEQNIDDLKKLIGDGEQRLPEALSDVLKMNCEGQDLHKNSELGIRWRLLRGERATEDSRVWLSDAVTIFHDPF
ncbi:UNVERIFIED_CONTAM: hypothetical protein Sangu_2533000 [Sesamum angustifolium]|uniref:Uncharacterized protein n=1 Tax=Sesamum angustifolium TaxID=2727405 RepID=A0AAW2JAY6_9LAMI